MSTPSTPTSASAKPTSIKIDEVEYVRADSVQPSQALIDGNLPYVIIRSARAGVFAGHLDRRDGQEASLIGARRLWRWAGANTLSDLAIEGPLKPAECKFSRPVALTVMEVIEVIPTTQLAKERIKAVIEWK